MDVFITKARYLGLPRWKHGLSKRSWKNWYQTEATATLSYLTHSLDKYIHTTRKIGDFIRKHRSQNLGYIFARAAAENIYYAAQVIQGALSTDPVAWKGGN